MLLFTALAFGADRVESSVNLAMGSTSVANPDTNAGVSMNPAVLGVSKRYHFEFAGSYGQRGVHWGISAVDSLTTNVGFGVTYSGDRYNPPIQAHELPGWLVEGQELRNDKRNQDIGASLAIPMAERRFSLGLGGSVSFYNHERQGKGTTGNLSVGAAYRPKKTWSLGVTGRNLLPIEDPSMERVPEVLGGLWMGEEKFGSLSLEGGYRMREEGVLVLAAGAEGRLSPGAIVRGGWRLEQGAHELTIGGGAGTADTSLDLALAVPVNSFDDPRDWTVQLSLRFKGPDFDSVRPD